MNGAPQFDAERKAASLAALLFTGGQPRPWVRDAGYFKSEIEAAAALDWLLIVAGIRPAPRRPEPEPCGCGGFCPKCGG